MNPFGGLIQGTHGNFYGATEAGGTSQGTAYSFSMGLPPFVETVPGSGKVGSKVKILGTGLTGVSSVTFNGTSAVFAVDSSTLITAAVPAGATSGKIQVVTSNGTLSSSVPFRVP